MSTKKKDKIEVIVTGNIFEVAHQTHHVVVRYCEYCGKPMSESDVNDFGSLCESCYMKEYYEEDDLKLFDTKDVTLDTFKKEYIAGYTCK